MGAQPKNKITRVERGKRRRGNTPKLTRDWKTAQIPAHKKGLVAQIFRAIGLETQAAKSSNK